MNPFGREPTAILGGLAEVVKAIIPLLIIFGFIRWSGEQVAQVMLVVGVVVGFLTVLFTRSQVAPAQDVQTALDAPAGTTPKQLEKIIERQS